MNSFNPHSSLCHHECRNRAVNSAGHENQALSVGTQRQSAKALNFIPINVCPFGPNIHVKQDFRFMHIHVQHLAGLENRCAYLTADFRRLHRKRLVHALCFYLEGFDSFLLDQFHHICRCGFADGIHIRYAAGCRTHGGHAENLRCHPNHFFLRHICRYSNQHQTANPTGFHIVEYGKGTAHSFQKYPFKVRAVHSLQCHFSAPNNVQILFHVCLLSVFYRKLPSLRNLVTAFFRRSMTKSISSIVLNSEKLNRIAHSISLCPKDMACSTWLSPV